MFRLSLQKKRALTVVTLDGRLADANLEEVHRVLSSVTGSAALNLGGLETCSERALSELRYFIDAGFATRGATPFIRMLLGKTVQGQRPPARKRKEDHAR